MGYHVCHCCRLHPWMGLAFASLFLMRSRLTLRVVLNIVIAFHMGPDVAGILASPIGQPVATVFVFYSLARCLSDDPPQILLNSLGKRGTLAVWSFIIMSQYVILSSPWPDLTSYLQVHDGNQHRLSSFLVLHIVYADQCEYSSHLHLAKTSPSPVMARSPFPASYTA